MSLSYTGIGSRKIDSAGYARAEQLGYWLAKAGLAKAGLTLRSGGAEGADAAFEAGARRGGGAVEAFLPWKGYNKSTSALYCASPAAVAMAKGVHPAWDLLGEGARQMHGCSAHQVLGLALDHPSIFTLCWTPDGCVGERTRTRLTGGTATGIVLSERNGIPCYNLNKPACLAGINGLLESLGVVFKLARPPVQDDLFSPPQRLRSLGGR